MRRLRCKETGKTEVRLQAAPYIFLSILTAVFCYLFCIRYSVFGSKVDWISQHSVLPDYFRQQFYETGEWFPEFAANIGGGQNIYNFAYYGLYNPILMLSYLLPSVKMSDYMTAVQFLSLVASVLLMYAWLGKRGFPRRICVGVTVMFLLSGPMIYHSYSQIMFVNYMPFLLTGLWGVDRYFCNKRPGVWLTVSIFLMIMTSFYFSIGGMLVLILYGLHRFLAVCDERKEKITIRLLLAEGVRFAAPFVLAVMMSGILLMPAAFALTGREGKTVSLSLADLLIPKMPVSRFCYSTYSIGLTTLALTALIAMLLGKRLYERALAWGCMAVLTIPVFAYLLNGGLYVRDKAMIPFLPLLCYILACYLNCQEETGESRADDLQENGRDRRRELFINLLPYVLTAVLIYICRKQGEAGEYWKLLLLDGLIMLACFTAFEYLRIRKKLRAPGSVVLMLPAILMLIVFGNACHAQGSHGVSRELYREVTDYGIGELIKKATEGEEGFYRTEQLGNDVENAANLNRVWDMGQYLTSVYSSSYHEGYREFRKNTFQLEEPFRNFLMQSAVHNPVFLRFMGVKYVVSDEDVPGYEPVESKGKRQVYRNDQVSPAAYATDRVITEKTYEELEFPYNQLALLRYAVAKEIPKDMTLKNNEARNAVGEELGAEDIISEELAESVKHINIDLPERVEAEENQTICFNLPGSQADHGERVFFLSFRVENLRPSKDVTVWVEGIRNKLTSENHFYYNDNTEFTYGVPLKEGQKSVEVVLGKGQYLISDVKAFLGTLPNEENERAGKDDGTEQKKAHSEKETGMSESSLYQSELWIDRKNTRGNCIAGTIDVKSPGYFITTIPYDENFEILADGKRVEKEEVNTAFLGFPIEAGKHEIRIVYHAPGVKAGKILSAAGVLLLLSFIFFRSRH